MFAIFILFFNIRGIATENTQTLPDSQNKSKFSEGYMPSIPQYDVNLLKDQILDDATGELVSSKDSILVSSSCLPFSSFSSTSEESVDLSLLSVECCPFSSPLEEM
jgi:hypothetical protein